MGCGGLDLGPWHNYFFFTENFTNKTIGHYCSPEQYIWATLASQQYHIRVRREYFPKREMLSPHTTSEFERTRSVAPLLYFLHQKVELHACANIILYSHALQVPGPVKVTIDDMRVRWRFKAHIKQWSIAIVCLQVVIWPNNMLIWRPYTSAEYQLLQPSTQRPSDHSTGSFSIV